MQLNQVSVVPQQNGIGMGYLHMNKDLIAMSSYHWMDIMCFVFHQYGSKIFALRGMYVVK
jgi:hypothetical protein